ncbi:MAG: hypothetical protein IJQ72_05405 [Bacilli bacterium]|nr:hypothetical protein [Bacilli bacterium]
MKKILILPALFALAVTGCGGDDPVPSGDVGWVQDVKEEMTEYLGLVLPFVQFDTATLYHGWNEDEGAYFIGDDSETNVLDGYGDRLLRTGWTPVTEEGSVNYTKSTEVGDLTLHAEWYEATDLYPCGNEIAVYVAGQGGGGDDPVTGTYEFVMEDYGWSDAEVISETTLAPGLTINASKNGGSNDPKYYASGASIRLYPNNSITFSADNMTKIEFTFTRIDDNFAFNPDSGTFSADYAAKTGVWTGDASSVTFTLGSGSGKQIRISAVKVTGTFSGGDPIGPGGDERTVEDVALDICDMLGYTASDIYWEDGEAYISVVFEDVTSLEEACVAGIDFLPTYLNEYEAPAAGQWLDGDDGYFASYMDSDSLTFVEIGSYLDGEDYVTQYCVYQMVY